MTNVTKVHNINKNLLTNNDLKNLIKDLTNELESRNDSRDLIASGMLREIYDNLDAAVYVTTNLMNHFKNNKDKRGVKVEKAINLIMRTQEIMNSFAQDKDIDIG